MAVIEESRRNPRSTPSGAVRDLLAGREELLRGSRDAIVRAAEEISREYNVQAKRPGYEGLSYESVNRIFKDLMCSLPRTARDLWPGLCGEGGEIEGRQIFRVFSWSFNRMKDRANTEEGPEFRIKARGEIEGEAMPYPAHTHLDVPYCMRALGIPSSELSLALAACHDTFEEGTGIRVELDEVGVRRVDLHELISRFPEGDLGASLAVGIAALTESRYVEIVLALPEEAILGFEECARRYRGDLSGFAGRAPVLTKIHLQDPLVFGGLALQIRETVASLVSAARGTAGSAALDLARAIVEVELGDRVSDIATLERQLEYYSDDLRFARYRTIAYASRMLNMHEKLREAAAFLPGCQLDPALAGYLTILETKLDEIGERLSDAGASRIGARSVADFHARAFLPIQAKADEIMTGFVRSKVGELVRPLIEPRGRPPGRVDKLPDTI